MLKHFNAISVFFLSVLLGLYCTRDKIVNNSNSVENGGYIILPGSPDNEGEDWFNVKNIFNNQTSGVPAVVEIEGTIYLPIFGRPPSFGNKVVEGVFVPDTNYYLEMTDTIFHVKKHIRDTLLGTWGG